MAVTNKAQSMGQTVLPGDPPIDIYLRRSARARRLSLRVSRLDGKVTLSLPRGVHDGEALRFARAKEGWIRSALHARPVPVAVGVGIEIPVEGVGMTVRAAAHRRAVIGDGAIHAPEKRTGVAVQALLKHLARDRLSAAADIHAARLGRTVGRMTLRDTRSRWGSCSARGDLMLSWRLIMAPPDVLDYVAAHEVAHLERMDHSPAFWRVVAGLCPTFEASRTWLRNEGETLHRYRFKD